MANWTATILECAQHGQAAEVSAVLTDGLTKRQIRLSGIVSLAQFITVAKAAIVAQPILAVELGKLVTGLVVDVTPDPPPVDDLPSPEATAKAVFLGLWRTYQALQRGQDAGLPVDPAPVLKDALNAFDPSYGPDL